MLLSWLSRFFDVKKSPFLEILIGFRPKIGRPKILAIARPESPIGEQPALVRIMSVESHLRRCVAALAKHGREEKGRDIEVVRFNEDQVMNNIEFVINKIKEGIDTNTHPLIP